MQNFAQSNIAPVSGESRSVPREDRAQERPKASAVGEAPPLALVDRLGFEPFEYTERN